RSDSQRRKPAEVRIAPEPGFTAPIRAELTNRSLLASIQVADGLHLGTAGDASADRCSALQFRLNGKFAINQLHAFAHAGESDSVPVQGYFRVKADAGVMYRQLDPV